LVAKKVLNLAVMWGIAWVDGMVNYLVGRKEDEMVQLTVDAREEHLVQYMAGWKEYL
jgi:hypothetical protein